MRARRACARVRFLQVNPLPFDREKLAEVITRRAERSGESKRRPHMTPAASGLSSGAGAAVGTATRAQLDADLAVGGVGAVVGGGLHVWRVRDSSAGAVV